jgi:hypothetical protein
MTVHYLAPSSGSALTMPVSAEQFTRLQSQYENLALAQRKLAEQLETQQQRSLPASVSIAQDHVGERQPREPQLEGRSGVVSEAVELASRNAERVVAFRQMEERFYSEGYDENWAAEMEYAFLEVEQRLQQLNFGATRIVTQECRSNTCRVEFEQGETADALLPGLLAAKGSKQVTLQNVSDEYGERIVALYQR